MSEAWTPERVVDVDLARALVADRFPDLAGLPVEPLGTGFDNTAFLVGGEWVFRFPRRAIAVPWIEREAALLPAIAKRVPLAVPVPERVARGDERYPWPFVGYRRLPGRTLCAAQLDDDARARLAQPLGRFLAALHSFPVDEAARLGAAGDELGRTDVPRRREKARTEIRDAAARGIVGDDVRLRIEAVLDATPDDLVRPPSVLVHADLYARHLVVDDAGRLAGVIDWGDVHLGDRSVDLMVAFWVLPAAARDAFCHAYGAIDAASWRLARFRAAYHAAATVRFAASIGDADLLRETRWALAG